MKVSWADQRGRSCWQVRVLYHLKPQILANWQHGWQYYASSASEHHFRENVVLAQSHASDHAHLRSHSGPGAGAVLHGAPSGLEFQVQLFLFRTLVLERLRLPLLLTDATVRVRWPELTCWVGIEPRGPTVWQVEAASSARGDRFSPGLP